MRTASGAVAARATDRGRVAAATAATTGDAHRIVKTKYSFQAHG
jgi:hypothetical protein